MLCHYCTSRAPNVSASETSQVYLQLNQFEIIICVFTRRIRWSGNTNAVVPTCFCPNHQQIPTHTAKILNQYPAAGACKWPVRACTDANGNWHMPTQAGADQRAFRQSNAKLCAKDSRVRHTHTIHSALPDINHKPRACVDVLWRWLRTRARNCAHRCQVFTNCKRVCTATAASAFTRTGTRARAHARTRAFWFATQRAVGTKRTAQHDTYLCKRCAPAQPASGTNGGSELARLA